MRVVIENTKGKSFVLSQIRELTFIQTFGAACDAAAVSFDILDDIGEATTLRLYSADRLIFNGRCDTQQISVSGSGRRGYIYARSSASLLVDSKSQPYTFDEPTAKQLYVNYARDKGFSCELPEIICKDRYEVSLGTSCFGAINNFVSLITGNEIYVDCNDCIRLRSDSEDIKRFDGYNILSLTKIINRSEPITQINFKNRLSNEYNLHTKARLAEDMDIERVEYMNLNSLPQWQRDYTIQRRLRNSFTDYKTVRATVQGWCSEEIGQRFCCKSQAGSFDDYVLREKKYCLNSTGEHTCLVLKKKTDMEAITYVD